MTAQIRELRLIPTDSFHNPRFPGTIRKILFATETITPDARFDVTADGRRFVVPTAASKVNPAPVIVMVNWTKGVKQ